MPGVVQAAGVGTQPFSNAPFVQFWIGDLEHTPDNQVAAQYLAVTENYFNTMGIRLVRGRDFSPADQPDSPWVVLVNETLAKQQWPRRRSHRAAADADLLIRTTRNLRARSLAWWLTRSRSVARQKSRR